MKILGECKRQDFPFSKLSAATISRWICNMIVEAQVSGNKSLCKRSLSS